MKIITPAMAVLLLSTLPAFAAEGAKPNVVTFNATVKVDVDATGKPVSTQAPEDLPQAIRSFIEKRVASWQYEPARRDGVATSATTYVKVGACAIPSEAGDSFRLGLDFKGNGPRLVDPSDRMPPPSYPSDLLRMEIGGAFAVSFTVQPDGSARVNEVTSLDGSNKHARLFRQALTEWVERLRYEPERVEGQAVPTAISLPVQFTIDTKREKMTREQWRDDYAAELQQRAITSRECMAATSSDGLMPLARNSPVKITPIPAS